MLLLDNCPDDDCIIFRNTFKMCREMDNQLDGLTGQDLQKLKSRFYREYESLEHMYRTNFAVRRYLQEHPLEVAYNIKRGGQSLQIPKYRTRFLRISDNENENFIGKSRKEFLAPLTRMDDP